MADSNVLYLGAAQGTTVSHVSDVVDKGTVVAVEISQKAFEKLLPLCERRENMLPLLADANKPAEYEEFLEEDWLFQAIAETYVPLLNLFEKLEDESVPYKITVSLSPTMVAMDWTRPRRPANLTVPPHRDMFLEMSMRQPKEALSRYRTSERLMTRSRVPDSMSE